MSNTTHDNPELLALELLEPLFKQVPLGVKTSVDDLATASGGFFKNAEGGYELIGREDLHEEVDLLFVVASLGARARRDGLHFEYLGDDNFELRRFVVPDAPLDVHEIVQFGYSICGDIEIQDSEEGILVESPDALVVGLFDGRFGLMSSPPNKDISVDVSEENLAVLSRALEMGDVFNWETEHEEPDCPDGTAWLLQIDFGDATTFISRGYGKLPECHDAFLTTLLSIFEGE